MVMNKIGRYRVCNNGLQFTVPVGQEFANEQSLENSQSILDSITILWIILYSLLSVFNSSVI